MHTLQIRNIPEDLFRRIKKSAKDSRRSMTQEAIVLLDKALSDNDDKKVHLHQRRKLAEEAAKKRKLTEEEAKLAIRWLREDRDR